MQLMPKRRKMPASEHYESPNHHSSPARRLESSGRHIIIRTNHINLSLGGVQPESASRHSGAVKINKIKTDMQIDI